MQGTELKSHPVAELATRDWEQISALGIGAERIISQLEILRGGPVYAKLARACSVGDGISRVSPADAGSLEQSFRQAVQRGRVMQFVPASGAATRMFKSLAAV